MEPLSMLAIASSVASTIFGFKADKEKSKAVKKQARRNQEAAYLDAANIEERGEQAFAVSQREAIAQDRKDTQVLRHLMASFSAGGPISSGQLALMAQMEAQKAYNMASILASGKSQEQAAEKDAAMRQLRGDMGVDDAKEASKAYGIAAGANLFAGVTGVASLYDRYKTSSSTNG